MSSQIPGQGQLNERLDPSFLDGNDWIRNGFDLAGGAQHGSNMGMNDSSKSETVANGHAQTPTANGLADTSSAYSEEPIDAEFGGYDSPK